MAMEFRWFPVCIMTQHVYVDIRFQKDVAAERIVRVCPGEEFGPIMDIGVHRGIQAMVSQKPKDVCICDPSLVMLPKMVPGINQRGKKGIAVCVVNVYSDIGTVQEVGRQAIEENVRTLQSQVVCFRVLSCGCPKKGTERIV